MFFVQVLYFNVNSKAVILMVAVTDWGIKAIILVASTDWWMMPLLIAGLPLLSYGCYKSLRC
jgi:hypothetical protein